MTGETIAATLFTVLTAAAFWKGVGALVRAWRAGSTAAQREVEKARREAAALVEREKEAAHALLREEYEQTCQEVRELLAKVNGLQESDQKCKLKLAKAMAWLAHFENALREAKINYVPFRPSDDDPEGDTPSGPHKVPKRRPPKGKTPDD